MVGAIAIRVSTKYFAMSFITKVEGINCAQTKIYVVTTEIIIVSINLIAALCNKNAEINTQNALIE